MEIEDLFKNHSVKELSKCEKGGEYLSDITWGERYKLIELVNKIAVESELNGADDGTYMSNEDNMRMSMYDFADYIGLDDYGVEKVKINHDATISAPKGIWEVYQIVLGDTHTK